MISRPPMEGVNATSGSGSGSSRSIRNSRLERRGLSLRGSRRENERRQRHRESPDDGQGRATCAVHWSGGPSLRPSGRCLVSLAALTKLHIETDFPQRSEF